MSFVKLVIRKSLLILLAGMVLAFVAACVAAPKRVSNRTYSSTEDLGDYSFIRYEKNSIDLHSTHNKWDNLFGKMEQIAFSGTGKVSIVHIGGSHVQGGFLSDRLRSNFQSMVYGAVGERGFVFPYEMAKTNSPKSVKAKWTGKWQGCRNALSTDNCEWGMSGINATTNDSKASVSIQATHTDSTLCNFNNAKIYYSKSSNVLLSIDSTIHLISTKENIAGGYNEYYFGTEYNELKFNIEATDTLPSSFSLQGVYLGNSNNGITYNAIGVNGASTKSYLRCAQFEDQMQTLNPDLVIFGIGVNDANVPETDFDAIAYEARYDSLCKVFLAVNPNACFLFVTNNDTYYRQSYPNKNALKVRETMQNLAKKYDGAVYDLFEIMGGLGSIDQWQGASLAAKDKIHLSKKGYELQADMMTTAFREAFGNYLDKR
jgi:lysophospholipase L1-like esterase